MMNDWLIALQDKCMRTKHQIVSLEITEDQKESLKPVLVQLLQANVREQYDDGREFVLRFIQCFHLSRERLTVQFGDKFYDYLMSGIHPPGELVKRDDLVFFVESLEDI